MWSGTFRSHPDSARHGLVADWYFTDRHGGVSRGSFESLNMATHVGDNPVAVHENRERLARTIAVEPDALAVLNAEHGARVQHITKDQASQLPPGDAAVTIDLDIALVALAADCAPIVLADVNNQVVGVVHCGWRGVVAGVIPAAIDMMLRAGAQSSSLAAIVGPTICLDCYEVNRQCAEQFAMVAPNYVRRDSEDKWRVDVAGAACRILSDHGVSNERIAECTYTNHDLFSYRRTGDTGRQCAAIVLRLGAELPEVANR